MAITQDDLDKLDKAIVSGVMTVEYADHRVTYQTISEMLKAKSIMEGQLAASARPSYRVGAVRSGFCP